jgi:hypothetical protein
MTQNTVDLVQLKKTFKDTIYGFIDTCIPLRIEDNYLYFMSPSNQLYGFDTKKNSFFEPSSSNKYSLVNDCINMYFTDTIKKSLEEKVHINFNDLNELILRYNYKEKHIGKKFFYSKSNNTIYVWNMINSKWESGEIDTLRYLFSNNEILQDNSKIYKSARVTSFEDLDIDMDDLEEVSARFRDGSIHYLHKTQNKVYSLNIMKNYWYIPDETIQKQIKTYVKKTAKNESESEKELESEHKKNEPELST